MSKGNKNLDSNEKTTVMNRSTNREIDEFDKRREAYNAYGWTIRALLCVLILDFMVSLNIYWGYWYITLAIAILTGIGIACVIHDGKKKGILACPHCNKMIWSNKKIECKACGNKIF